MPIKNLPDEYQKNIAAIAALYEKPFEVFERALVVKLRNDYASLRSVLPAGMTYQTFARGVYEHKFDGLLAAKRLAKDPKKQNMDEDNQMAGLESRLADYPGVCFTKLPKNNTFRLSSEGDFIPTRVRAPGNMDGVIDSARGRTFVAFKHNSGDGGGQDLARGEMETLLANFRVHLRRHPGSPYRLLVYVESSHYTAARLNALSAMTVSGRSFMVSPNRPISFPSVLRQL